MIRESDTRIRTRTHTENLVRMSGNQRTENVWNAKEHLLCVMPCAAADRFGTTALNARNVFVGMKKEIKMKMKTIHIFLLLLLRRWWCGLFWRMPTHFRCFFCLPLFHSEVCSMPSVSFLFRFCAVKTTHTAADDAVTSAIYFLPATLLDSNWNENTHNINRKKETRER